MRLWLVAAQVGLLVVISWQVWGIKTCDEFTTTCSQCAGAYYAAGCGRLCMVGRQITDRAYTCCCNTNDPSVHCCEGRCVVWDCVPNC